LIGADRTTHLKILAVALAGATAVVAVGITARVMEPGAATAHIQAAGPVLKAGRPKAFTTSEITAIR
jgi:hypothetical protein